MKTRAFHGKQALRIGEATDKIRMIVCWFVLVTKVGNPKNQCNIYAYVIFERPVGCP